MSDNTSELLAAADRVLKWAAPIAGDNRDDEAANEEMASVEALQAAIAKAEARARIGEPSR